MRKIVTAAIAGTTAIAASLTMAGMASASTGTPRISPEESGYSATGARFKDVSASVYLRNPEQYAVLVAGYGHSVQLWSSGLVIVLGVSGSTAGGGEGAGVSPAVTVFDRGTHAVLASSTNSTIPAQWRLGASAPRRQVGHQLHGARGTAADTAMPRLPANSQTTPAVDL